MAGSGESGVLSCILGLHTTHKWVLSLSSLSPFQTGDAHPHIIMWIINNYSIRVWPKIIVLSSSFPKKGSCLAIILIIYLLLSYQHIFSKFAMQLAAPLSASSEARHGHRARRNARASNGSPTRNDLAEPGPPATNVRHPNARGRPPSGGVRNLGTSMEIAGLGGMTSWNRDMTCL